MMLASGRTFTNLFKFFSSRNLQRPLCRLEILSSICTVTERFNEVEKRL